MARFRLAPVLRARLAQEDVAKAEVVRARGRIQGAERLARRRARELDGSHVPTGVTAQATVAALVARQSLAATLAAAEHDVLVAEVQADERLAALAEAAKRRRVVERLGERHAAHERARAEAADQAAIDEIATTTAMRRDLGLRS
jgi:flagellar export protein FliJ